MRFLLYEPVHEISNNVVCATSKASGQPTLMHSLIGAFACHLDIIWVFSCWLNVILSFWAYKEAAQARLGLHLSECHVVDHVSRLIYNG